jgi:hypothetical protein
MSIFSWNVPADSVAQAGRTQSRWADHIYVIARSRATKQSQSDEVVDCFAALQMRNILFL